MADYSVGGKRSAGGYGVGYRENSGWVSLGDTSIWSGNILGKSQEVFDAGAYTGGVPEQTTPTAIMPLAEVNGVFIGYYAGLYSYDTPQIRDITFVMSEDGTPATIYTRTGFTPSLQYMETEELDYMQFFISTDGHLHLGFGMTYTQVGAPCTVGEAMKIIAEGQGAYLSPVVDLLIVNSNGDTIEEDDLDMMPEESFPAGGGGSWDNDSETIPWAELPTLGAYNSGMVAVYNPSMSEMVNFSNFLWSHDVFDTVKKFIASPMELIVSLSVVPVAPPLGERTNIKIGGIDTEITSTLISNQYMAYDCGTLAIPEYFGGALDYGTYSRISLYLPFIGVREVKTDECMGGTLSIRYNIDLVSGACIAMVACSRQGLNSVLYTFEGNIATQIPLSSRDFSTVYTAIARGVIDTAVGGTGGLASGAKDLLTSAVGVMSAKPSMTRSGSLSANGGLMDIHTPYVIIERPVHFFPSDSNKFYGRPCNMTKTLGSLTGYTECESVILDGIPCTDEELELIREALIEGTIF